MNKLKNSNLFVDLPIYIYIYIPDSALNKL